MATYFTIDDSEIVGLTGKVAIITGASSGIGLATAKLFIAKGAQAIVVADLQPSKEDLGSRADFVRTNVTSWKDLTNVFKHTVEKYGRVDIVFANAGVADSVDYMNLMEAEGELVQPSRLPININLFGCMDTVTLACHYMKDQPGGGNIIMTSSGAGYHAVNSAAYGAAKHGVIGFLRTMAPKLHPNLPIRLNALCPGYTNTGITSPSLDVFNQVGVRVQSAHACALAAAKMIVDPSYHGKALFSADNRCAEFEGPMLAKAVECFADTIGTEEERSRIMKVMKERRDEAQNVAPSVTAAA